MQGGLRRSEASTWCMATSEQYLRSTTQKYIRISIWPCLYIVTMFTPPVAGRGHHLYTVAKSRPNLSKCKWHRLHKIQNRTCNGDIWNVRTSCVTATGPYLRPNEPLERKAMASRILQKLKFCPRCARDLRHNDFDFIGDVSV